MRKKSVLDQAAAGKAVQQMLRQLNTNAREIGSRTLGGSPAQKLCMQLCELSHNLLEWGFHSGNIEIWASFVPSMFDYSTTDELYAAEQEATAHEA